MLLLFGLLTVFMVFSGALLFLLVVSIYDPEDDPDDDDEGYTEPLSAVETFK